VLRAQLPANSDEPINFDLFEDWNMIIGGIYQTFGIIDLKTIRAYEFMNVLIPNMHKDTHFMNVIRIRSTPNSKLNDEEKKLKIKYKLKSVKPIKPNKGSSQGFADILKSLAR